jgi:hypothetical protein
VNNHQAEHLSTVLKTSSMMSDRQFSIWIDLGATKSFISNGAHKRIKVKAIEQDEFRYVELAYRAKQKVGGKVNDCKINLGEFVASVNLFVTTLGSYDIVIGMDWLESYDMILNCKMKILSGIDDMAQIIVIIGRNQGVSLKFISSLQLQKNMRKGCNLYAISVLNEKGDAERLEDFSVVSDFADVFPEELVGAPPKRELEFTIELKPRA